MLMGHQYKPIYNFVNKEPCLFFYNQACSVPRMKYGQRLKAARRHAKLSQEQLAEKIGNVTSQANISYLENSDATGSEYTVQFADACGVRPMWLAEEQGDMVDGYYVERAQLVHLLKVAEPLPDYAVDQLVRHGHEIAELLARAAQKQ